MLMYRVFMQLKTELHTLNPNTHALFILGVTKMKHTYSIDVAAIDVFIKSIHLNL